MQEASTLFMRDGRCLTDNAVVVGVKVWVVFVVARCTHADLRNSFLEYGMS